MPKTKEEITADAKKVREKINSRPTTSKDNTTSTRQGGEGGEGQSTLSKVKSAIKFAQDLMDKAADPTGDDKKKKEKK